MKKPETWMPVGELAKGFASRNYALPLSGDLAGKELKLYFEDGALVECSFATIDTLLWKTTAMRSPVKEACSVTRVRQGIYFVDLVKHLERATTLSLVLDLRRGVFTAVEARLPQKAETRGSLLSRIDGRRELTDVAASFRHGAIGRPFEASMPRHAATEDLVGKRIEYTYSPTECYEHIYLNGSFYTWHCLRGEEKGLADTDVCHFYKLARKLYLFVWREKIVPTLGVVVVDLEAMRTSGKILGYEGNDFGKVVNFRVGARARLQNITVHRKARRGALR